MEKNVIMTGEGILPLLPVQQMCYPDLVANKLIGLRFLAMHPISRHVFIRVCALFITLTVGLFAETPPALAAMVFCNHTQTALDVAFGRHETKQWISEGWWRIEPSQCARVYSRPLSERTYFYYAASAHGQTKRDEPVVWGGVYKFCTSSKAFRAKGNEHCESKGLEEKGFQMVDIGSNFKNYTLNFDTPKMRAARK